MSVSNTPWAVNAQQEEPYLDSEEDWSQFMYEWSTLTTARGDSPEFNFLPDPEATVASPIYNSRSDNSWSSGSLPIQDDANKSFFSTKCNKQQLSGPSQSVTPPLVSPASPLRSNLALSGLEIASSSVTSQISAEEPRSTQEPCYSCKFCTKRFTKQHLLK